jgi:hypothetical protein
MAFALHQTWNSAVLPDRAAGRLGGQVGAIASVGLSPATGRAVATLLSIVVHILLIWILLNRLVAAAPPDDVREPPASPMILIDLGGVPSPSTGRAQSRPEPKQPQQATAQVDASTPSAAPNPEWTMTRLTGAPAMPAGDEGGGSSGSGRGEVGPGGYDPYAGAAPLRRGDGLARPERRVPGLLSDDADLAIDQAVLEAARRLVAAKLPGQAGTVEVTVRVSATGVVIEAAAHSGSAPLAAREALAKALIGKRIYREAVSSPGIFTLPTVRLG